MTQNTERNKSHYGRVGYLVATALARKYNIQIQFGQGGLPRCNSRNEIYLPMFTIDGPEAGVLVNGMIDHEASHAALTDWQYVPDASEKPILASLANIFEDVRIEKTMGQRYPGLPMNIHRAEQVMIQRGILTGLPDDAPPTAVLQSYVVNDLRARVLKQTALQPFADDARQRLVRMVPRGVMVRLQALMNEVVACKSTRDTTALAKKVMQMLEEEAKKNPPPSQQQDGDGQGTGGQGQGQGGGQGQSNGQNNGQGQNKGQGNGSGRSNGQSSGNKSAGNGNDDDQSGGSGGNGAGGGGDDSIGQGPQNLQNILDTTTDQIEKGVGEMLQQQVEQMAQKTPAREKVVPAQAAAVTGSGQNASEIMARASRPAASLMQRAAALMQAKTLDETRLARSGKRIDSRQLPRLDRGDFRVFQRRREGTSVETALLILIDKSGSMSSDAGNGVPAIQVALDCAMAVGLAMDRIYGVSYCIGAFPGYRGGVAVLNRFGEKIKHSAQRFPMIGASGGTPMAEAIAWATGELMMQPQPRKILLVLTDGAPNDEAAAAYALRVANEVGVETMGIGIATPVSHLFKDSEQVGNVSELPRAMFGMLQRAFLNAVSG